MKKYENVKTKKQTLIFIQKKKKKTKKYLIIKKIDIKILLKLENVNLNYSSFELNHSNLINLKKKINYYIIRIN